MIGIKTNLLAAIDFYKYQQAFSCIQGYLPDQQAYTLLQLAQYGPATGEIVEIGSFCGRSTTFLATGSKLAGREKVSAIDHFKGSVEHQNLPGIDNLFAVFQHNIAKHNVADWINVCVGDSPSVAKDWSKPIRLLFIDGSHEYEPSRIDFEMWSPFVVHNGLICFHDVENSHWPGDDSVTRFYRELMSTTSSFVEVLSIDSRPHNWGFLKVIQRIG